MENPQLTPLLIRYCLSCFISSFFFPLSFPLVIFNLCVLLIFSVYSPPPLSEPPSLFGFHSSDVCSRPAALAAGASFLRPRREALARETRLRVSGQTQIPFSMEAKRLGLPSSRSPSMEGSRQHVPPSTRARAVRGSRPAAVPLAGPFGKLPGSAPTAACTPEALWRGGRLETEYPDPWLTWSRPAWGLLGV